MGGRGSRSPRQAPGGIPSTAKDVQEGKIVEVNARDIFDRGYTQPPNMEQGQRMANARAIVTAGQRDPITLVVSPKGTIEVHNGRHRLQAAIELNAKIKVKFTRGSKYMDNPMNTSVETRGGPRG